MPDAPESRPVSAPRKTLVEMFVQSPRVTVDSEYALARLREADVLQTALDEARICADTDGLRIRELADDLAQERHAVAVLRADRDRETVNREAAQRVLAETVRERDALAERYTRLRVVVADELVWLSQCSYTVPADALAASAKRLGALLKEGT